jgi:aminobenzoyl-glutamate transport protein
MMAGLVAIISLMIPYTVVFMLAWAIMITIWMLLGIPVGIEGPIHMLAM